MEGKIIVFSGYAGAGKSTIINELRKRNKKLEYIPSITTRPKRTGEIEGRPYYFRSEQEFTKEIERGSFIEYENVHGHLYGTLKDLYEEKLDQYKTILKDIDVNGAMSFKQEFGDKVILIFVKPTNPLTVVERMRKRGETERSIQKRKERIEYETSFISKFDTVIINDNLDVAVKEVENIIKIL